LGAAALRRGDYPRAAKMLQKSLQLHPLPGVQALWEHAKGQMEQAAQSEAAAQQQQKPAAAANSNTNGSSSSAASQQSSANNNNSNNTNTTNTNTNPRRSFQRSASSSLGADGREYTPEQSAVVKQVLEAKKGGRGAHYRVLQINQAATESEIKVRYGVVACCCCCVCVSI